MGLVQSWRWWGFDVSGEKQKKGGMVVHGTGLTGVAKSMLGNASANHFGAPPNTKTDSRTIEREKKVNKKQFGYNTYSLCMYRKTSRS